MLLVVGYSEADELIVNELIAPLEERWKVVRIGPLASGALALATSADVALPSLRHAIEARGEARAWSYSRFEPQHGVGWALCGRGLGSHDVMACPAVPEVSIAVAELRATGSVTIVGKSGAGKSWLLRTSRTRFGVTGLKLWSWPMSRLIRQTPSVVAGPAATRGCDPRRRAALDAGCLARVAGVRREGLVPHRSAQWSSCWRGGRSPRCRSRNGVAGCFICATETRFYRSFTDSDARVGDAPMDEPLGLRLEEALEQREVAVAVELCPYRGLEANPGDMAELRTGGGYDLVWGLSRRLSCCDVAASQTQRKFRSSPRQRAAMLVGCRLASSKPWRGGC